MNDEQAEIRKMLKQGWTRDVKARDQDETETRHL